MKLGVITDCFKTDLKSAVTFAKTLGAKGVQIYAVSDSFSASEVTSAVGNDLTVSALCGDLGGHGFEIEKDNDIKIEKTKKIIDIASELKVPVVTTHIGVIPSDATILRYKVMLSALKTLGVYADSKGVTLAIETGPEDAETLYNFIKQIPCGVGVNLDPANFKMVTGQDPVSAVYKLKDYIVHTHLKDGIMLKKTEPKVVYDHFAEGGIEALNISDLFLETPVGQGSMDFANYLKALKDIGYNGFLTVERETGDDPSSDIKLAFDYIKDNFSEYLD